MRFREKMAAVSAGVGDNVRELMFVAGVGLAGYGASLVYYPAGYIVAGVGLVSVAIFGVR